MCLCFERGSFDSTAGEPIQLSIMLQRKCEILKTITKSRTGVDLAALLNGSTGFEQSVCQKGASASQMDESLARISSEVELLATLHGLNIMRDEEPSISCRRSSML